MRKILFISLLFLSLLLLGCTNTPTNEYLAKFKPESVPVFNFSDPSSFCTNNNCSCYTCENDSYNPLFAIVFDPSLKNGECHLISCTSEEEFDKLADFNSGDESSNPFFDKEFMKYFMLGQGPSFAEFQIANEYCNNSMSFSVRWLDGRDDEYPIPSYIRAECFLDKSVLPVYLLYSDNKHVDPQRAEEIARVMTGTLYDTGPVIITSELNFNSSDQIINSKVASQIYAMSHACEKCQIALAPKFQDYTALDLLNPTRHQTTSSQVDLVYGVDYRDLPYCTSDQLISDILNYSGTIWYDYGKPSLVAYIALAPGYNPTGNCNWTEEAVSTFYHQLPFYAPLFVKNGIIGVAPYRLYARSIDPLNCSDCYLLTSSGSSASNPDYRLNRIGYNWFKSCRTYYTSYGQIPLVMPNNRNTLCTFGSNPAMYLTGESTTTALDFNETTDQLSRSEPFYKCDACFITKEFAWDVGTASIDEHFCEVYPSLDIFADMYDIDPAMLRAITYRESSFEPCLINDNVALNSRRCGHKITSVSSPECGDFNARPGHKICAFGISQLTTPPEYLWEDGSLFYNGVPAREEAERCTIGDEEFDPFNPEHAFCVSAQLMKKWTGKCDNLAKRLANTPYDPTDEDEVEEYNKEVSSLSAFCVSLSYLYGYSKASSILGMVWNSYLNQIHLSSDDVPEGECYGYDDFFDYIRECNYDLPRGVRRSSVRNRLSVLALYNGFRETCGYCDESSWKDNICSYLGSEIKEEDSWFSSVCTH